MDAKKRRAMLFILGDDFGVPPCSLTDQDGNPITLENGAHIDVCPVIGAPVPMSVYATRTESVDTPATNHTITLPDVPVGTMLFVSTALHNNAGFGFAVQNISAGWTVAEEDTAGLGATGRYLLLWRVKQAGDPLTLSFDVWYGSPGGPTVSVRRSTAIYAIRNVLAQAPTLGSKLSAGTETSNPPALALPSAGTWLTVAHLIAWDLAAAPTTWPYTNDRVSALCAGGRQPATAMCHTTVTATAGQSVDPGTFTHDTAFWTARTIAFKRAY